MRDWFTKTTTLSTKISHMIRVSTNHLGWKTEERDLKLSRTLIISAMYSSSKMGLTIA